MPARNPSPHQPSRRTLLAGLGAAAASLCLPAAARAATPRAWSVDELDAGAFEPYVGQTFHIRRDPVAPVPLTLRKVTRKPRGAVPGRAAAGSAAVELESFTLLFGAAGNTGIEDGIHTVEHPRFGVASLFVVEVGVRASDRRYEVVVNRVGAATGAAPGRRPSLPEEA